MSRQLLCSTPCVLLDVVRGDLRVCVRKLCDRRSTTQHSTHGLGWLADCLLSVAVGGRCPAEFLWLGDGVPSRLQGAWLGCPAPSRTRYCSALLWLSSGFANGRLELSTHLKLHCVSARAFQPVIDERAVASLLSSQFVHSVDFCILRT